MTAIFLGQTLRVVGDDGEMMAAQQLAQKEKYVEKLRDFFNAADTSGDGSLSEEEFGLVFALMNNRRPLLGSTDPRAPSGSTGGREIRCEPPTLTRK